MADPEGPRDEPRFRAALELLNHIANVEKVRFFQTDYVSETRLATRAWILNTYAMCIDATKGGMAKPGDLEAAEGWLSER